jgi:hypothetical protein
MNMPAKAALLILLPKPLGAFNTTSQSEVFYGKRRIELLPLLNSPLYPVSGAPIFGAMSSCARHLGGCLLARAPDLLILMSWAPV